MPTQDLLEKKIDFTFNDNQLLKLALTHSSAAIKKGSVKLNNERLEFLGDSVLKLMISDLLYQLYPTYNEGDLSKIRSQLISDKFLATLAQEIQLGDYLMLSYGEKKSGGATKPSNLANAFEALLGACYLDQGLAATQIMYSRILGSIESRLQSFSIIDHKSVLQEFTQKKQYSMPVYSLINTSGPDHDKLFFVEGSVCSDKLNLFSHGSGSTKKAAEQLAAKKLLLLLNNVKH